MATLYPPYIEGKLPAQISGEALRFPYALNRAQGVADLLGMRESTSKPAKIKLRIKTVSTNELISDEMSCLFENNEKNGVFYTNFILNKKINYETLQLEEVVNKISLQVGQYYKIQMAFENNETPGVYYSTIGVFKYTEKPQIFLEGLNAGSINNFNSIYTGVYKNTDASEKVEQYKFIIYKNGEIIEDTGWRIHNALLDNDSYSSIDVHEFDYASEIGEQFYHAQYGVKTINGLEIFSPIYYLHKNIDLPLFLPVDAFLTNNYEEGSVKVKIRFRRNCYFRGKYWILRKEKDNNIWYKMKNILIDVFQEFNDEIVLFEDFTIEQGKEYEYAIQQYDDSLKETLYSEKKILGKIVADFEDAFLYDGQRQLKIRFNPKISSIKTTIQETKSNTIGSKYPFFYRNGRVGAKEFPISGLISYLMDENNKFIIEKDKENELNRKATESGEKDVSSGKNIDLVSENIAKEREFKFKVLDWLDDGQPKLFRSPTEGNYLIRLTGNSLTPNDTLGRMLHTFSSTAVEIAEINYNNLLKYQMLGNKQEYKKGIHYVTKTIDSNEKIFIPSATKAQIYAPSGSTYKLWFSNSVNPIEITIGISEFYNIFIDKDDVLIAIQCLTSASGIIEYGYLKENEYHIYNNSKPVLDYEYKQVCLRIESNQTFQTSQEDGVEQRIVYLRVEKKVNDNSLSDSDCFIKIVYEDNSINLINLYQQGRIEYTKDDFNGVKIPIKEINVGYGIYADIYYHESKIIYGG